MVKTIYTKRKAFTIAELLVVLGILSISAMVVPIMAGNTDALQVRSAAEQIVSLITFAQNSSITMQENVQIVYDSTSQSFEAQNAAGVTITGSPTTADGLYRVRLGEATQCPHVSISSADFDDTNSLWFDRLGAPHGGSLTGEPLPLLTGSIVVTAGNETLTISIQPFTGQINVN